MIFYQLRGNCDQKHPYPPPKTLFKALNWRYLNRLFLKTIPLFFLITGIFSLDANAQNITLKTNQTPLRSVLNKIEQQTGYDFWYNKGTIDESEKINIDFKNQSLESVLKSLLSPRKLSFEMVDKTIFVRPASSLRTPKAESLRSTIQTDISGVIKDVKGNLLSSATIRLKGSDRATTTDANGSFIFSKLPEQGTILINSIGYLSQEINYTKNGNRNFSVILEEARTDLQEVNVVSTGYQQIPLERATGSFAQPIKEMFDRRIAPDLLSKLKGITSGLIFNSNSTRTSSGQTDINIRGRSTMYANDQPLIVLDNFPFTGDIRNINPNDIESVTVLKDAAAASIWGVRAGNGVIVITTKQGKAGTPLNISFSAAVSMFEKPDLRYNPNQLSSLDYIGLEKTLFDRGYYDANLNDIINYPVISPAVELLWQHRSGVLSSEQLASRLSQLSH